jgi:hypothetical protein
MINGTPSGNLCLLINLTLENKKYKLHVNPIFKATTEALWAFLPKTLNATHCMGWNINKSKPNIR